MRVAVPASGRPRPMARSLRQPMRRGSPRRGDSSASSRRWTFTGSSIVERVLPTLKEELLWRVSGLTTALTKLMPRALDGAWQPKQATFRHYLSEPHGGRAPRGSADLRRVCSARRARSRREQRARHDLLSELGSLKGPVAGAVRAIDPVPNATAESTIDSHGGRRRSWMCSASAVSLPADRPTKTVPGRRGVLGPLSDSTSRDDRSIVRMCPSSLLISAPVFSNFSTRRKASAAPRRRRGGK